MNQILILFIFILNSICKGDYISKKNVNFNWFLGPIKYSQNSYKEFFEEHFKYTLKTYSPEKSKCKLVGSWGVCLDKIILKFNRPEYKNLRAYKKGNKFPQISEKTETLIENDLINLIENDLKEIVNSSTLMAQKCKKNLIENYKNLKFDEEEKKNFKFDWEKIPKVVRTALIALIINNDIDLRTSSYISFLKLNIKLFQNFFDCEFMEFGKTIKEMAYYSTNNLFYKNLSDLVLTLNPKCDSYIKLLFLINDNYKDKNNLKMSLNIIEKTFQHLSNNSLEIGIYSFSDKLYPIFEYKKINNLNELKNLKKLIDSHQETLNLKNTNGKDLKELLKILKNNNNKNDAIKTNLFIFSNNNNLNNINNNKSKQIFKNLINYGINISAIQVDNVEKRNDFNKFSENFKDIVNDKNNIIDVKNSENTDDDLYALISRECNPVNIIKQNTRNNYLPIINKVPEIIKINSNLDDKFVIEIDIGKYKEEFPSKNKGKIFIMPEIPNPDCYFNVFEENLENKSYKFIINHEDLIRNWKQKSQKLNVDCKSIDVDTIDQFQTIPDVKKDGKFYNLLKKYKVIKSYELENYLNFKKYYDLFYTIKRKYISLNKDNKNFIKSNQEIMKELNKKNFNLFIKIESEKNISSIITIRKCKNNECNNNNEELKIKRKSDNKINDNDDNKKVNEKANKKPKIKVDYQIKKSDLKTNYQFNFNALDD